MKFLVSVMKSPKTFTTEDVVEINCHGGIATTNKVLELVLENGARMAEPGEFTKRAFFKWSYRFDTSRICYGFNKWKKVNKHEKLLCVELMEKLEI